MDIEAWRMNALEVAPGKYRRLIDCLADHAVVERQVTVSAPDRPTLIAETRNASATVSRKLSDLDSLGLIRFYVHGGAYVGPTEWKLVFPKRHSDVIPEGDGMVL